MRWLLVIALAAPQGPVGHVAWVEGTVTITRAGEQVPAPLKAGTALRKGDHLRAEPGADAGLWIDGQLRKLASLPGGRWTAGEPFVGTPPSSRPAGVDFARREELEAKVGARGSLALVGGTSAEPGLGGIFDQRSGGGGSGLGSGWAAPLEGEVPATGAYALPAPANARAGRLTIRRGRKIVWRGQVDGARFELPALWTDVRYSWKLETNGEPPASGSFRVKRAAPRPGR